MKEKPLVSKADAQAQSEKRKLLIDECIFAVGALGCLSYIVYDFPRLSNESNHYIFFVRLGSYVVAVLGTYDFGSQFAAGLMKLHKIRSDSLKNTPSSSDQV